MNKTVRAYDKMAELYDSEVIDFWHNFPVQNLKEFSRNLKGKKVLSIGSGTGRDAILLSNLGLEVTCFDASKKMVEITKDIGFKSIQGDIKKINFKDSSFDAVWAYTSLLHLKKDQMLKALKKVHDIIKKDGLLFIGMIEGEGKGYKEREGWGKNKRYFRFYKKKELKELIESTGFKLLFQSVYVPHTKKYINQIYQKI